MTNNERFVPIPELSSLAEFNPEVHQLSWDFSLPPVVDAERIVVDAHALGRVQGVAGFLSNHVREYVGDRSEYEMSVTGVGTDGSATAGKAKQTKKAETGKSALMDQVEDDPYGELMRSYFMTSPLHRLNRTEIASRVVDDVRMHGVTREKAWAYELNDALVESMNKAAYKHLIGRIPVHTRTINSIFTAGILPLNAAMAGGNIPATSAGIICGYGLMALLSVAKDSLINKRRYGETYVTDRRWTLDPFANWQPDRYVATLALTAVSPLVRYRK